MNITDEERRARTTEVPKANPAIVECIFDGKNNQFVALTSFRGVELMSIDALPREASAPAVTVTDNMVVKACRTYYGPLWGFVEAEMMRAALEAALSCAIVQNEGE